MPVYKIKHKNKVAYRFGKHGTIYVGERGRKKAEAQGRAIFASKFKTSKKK